jgi:hypothetical protein
MRDGSHIEAKINQGVRQGCNLSPALFDLYLEEAITQTAQGFYVSGYEG